FWNRLTEPVHSVQDPDQRRRARLLASLFLIAALSILIIDFLLIAAEPNKPESATQFVVAAISGGMLLLTYAISRLGRYRLACIVLVIFGMGATFTPTLLVGGRAGVRDLYYLVSMVLFGGLFLSLRLTFVIFVVQIAGIIALKWVVPGEIFNEIVSGPLSFNLFISIAAMLIFHYAQRLETERQAQLAASERRYRSLVENIRDIVYVQSVEGILLSVNAVTERLTGWSREELIGERFERFVHPDDLPRIAKLYAQLRRGETLSLYEVRVLCKSGGYLQVEFQITPQYEAGRMAHLFGVGRDITLRKQTEAALQENQRFNERVAENAPFMIHVFDLVENRNVFLNRFILNFYELTFEELQAAGGAYYDARIHPADMERVMQYRGRLPHLKDDEVATQEYRMKNPRGEWRWLHSQEVVFTRDSDGAPRQILGITSDVTEQRQTEDALRESEEKYRHFMEITPIAVAVCKLDGTLVYLNAAGLKLIGVAAVTEILGHSMWEFVPPNWQDAARQRFNSVALGIESSSYEYQIIRADGQMIEVEGRATPVRYQWEPAALLTLLDISERKQADAQRLQIMIERERLSLINRFILAISHDFRTSLATIETSRYLAEKRLPDNIPDGVQSKLDTIKSYVERMAEQLENLHIVYSLNDPQIQPTDINYLLQDLINRQGAFIGQKHLTFHFLPNDAASDVLVDEQKIRVAFKHLLLNALVYTPEHGTIWVSTRKDDGCAAVEVRDTGPGISAHDLPHIFDLFYRADPARTIDSGGVGLGLSIVKMIVDAHDGTIDVTSEPGQGSTFTVTLPMLS
ncbi:MAG: PAS domain S-box protein, partial [Anaerolineae bacterium]|nr:PAS domain S-box protein [Anaerolineae bacterium]